MRLSKGDRLLQIFIYAVLLFLGFIMLYPFWNAGVISLNNGMDTARGGITFWPRKFSLMNYKMVFENESLLRSFIVTILRTGIGTLLSVFFTAVFGYGMSKKELVGRKFYMIFSITTMYFSGGLIPSFLLMRSLHLMNNFWVMVLPGIISVYNMIIFRTFFEELPAGLEESAKIDGCNSIHTFFRIVLPISGPVFATISLFTAVGHWNSWFDAAIYINDQKLQPIQTILNQILNSNSLDALRAKGNIGAAGDYLNKTMEVTPKALQMATMMVLTIPIMCIYPFLQKYFTKGVLIGSIKG